MRKLIAILLIHTLFVFDLNAQQGFENLLGIASYEEIKKDVPGTPCSFDEETLIYCLPDNAQLILKFRNDVFTSFNMLEQYKNKFEAFEKSEELKSEVMNWLNQEPEFLEVKEGIMYIFNYEKNNLTYYISIFLSHDNQVGFWTSI